MAEKIAYEIEIKNVTQVTKLKEELKKLRKQNKLIEKDTAQNTKAGKNAAAQYTKNSKAIGTKSKKLRELNKELRTGTTATKKATKSNNSMAKQFIKGAAAIGIVVGAFRAVNRIVSSVVSVFTEFEFVMAKVNAVSGATELEFKALTATAEELGRTTFFTAAQVGELMLNFSKLGFTASEIQDAVQPTLDLATATGSDLARAALVAGAAVRGFGLDASETQRVVDVMAVSFSSSAMNIEKWQTSMTKVAPIAKAAGFSIEDTAAIMSKLTDSGIEASIAGTSFRNILLKMQDPTSELSKRFGKTIHSLDELVPAMKQFVAEGGSMADVMEVVDLRQAAAFEQMLTTADGTIALRDALLDANGEGARMAAIVGDTLQGAFLKFTSAMQGLSISVMKGFAEGLQGTVEGLAKFMNGLAENSQAIITSIKWLTKLVKWFGIYKLTLITVSGLTFAYNKLLALQRLAAIRAAGGMTTLATATMAAKRAMQALWGATGIGLVIVALSELVPWLLKTSEAEEEVASLTDRVADAFHDSIQPIEKLKTQSEELIRVKGLMNDMVSDGLIVLDKEGKVLKGTAIDQKTYNKFKGQAAILTRGLNSELKKNDQTLITEKTSIEDVASAIDILTTALMNQALVKGFEKQIERIAEVAANAEVARQKLLAVLGVEMNELFEDVGITLDELLEEAAHLPKNALEVARILEDAGFDNWKDFVATLSGSEAEIEAVTKAFDKLAGGEGIGALIISMRNLREEEPPPPTLIKDWAQSTKEAINTVKESRLDSMLTDEEWVAKHGDAVRTAVMTEESYKDKVLEIRATMLASELATLEDTVTNEKRITAIKQQQLDIQLQQKERAFKKSMDTLTTTYNDEATKIKDAYTVNGRLTEEGNRLLLELERQYLMDKAGLHGDYGKKLLGINGQIADSNRQLHEANMRQMQEQISAMGGIGGALQTLAGDNEALNGVKEAGIAISEAASIATAFLTLQENLETLGIIKHNVAKGTEIALKTSDIALTDTDTASTIAKTTATTLDTTATNLNTTSDTLALAPKATNAILNQGSGDPYTAIFRILAMIAIVAVVMSMFMKKGGLIPEGKLGKGGLLKPKGKFAKGGMVRGKSHAQGGEKFGVGGRVVELEGGEAVINKRSTAMFKDQLSSMNQAGGGNKFADGGLLNMPSFATASFGALSGGSGGSTQKVIVVESDITKTQRKVNVIEAAATI